MAHQADATRMLDDRGYTGTLIRGQNPLLLFEKAVRDRIIDSYYWKEQCFGLNAATLCDRAVELSFIGGTYGIGQKPTPFLCLAFKLLQLTPEKDIILHYLRQEEWKYLRALAAFYIRLTWEPKDIYETLEGYLSDYRKLKRRTRDGYQLSYIDQFVDDLLTKDRVCATSLWKMPSRTQLEDIDVLEPRVSALGDEIDELDKDDEDMKDGSDGEVEEVRNGDARSRSRIYDSRSRSRSYDRRRSRSRSYDRYERRSRSRSYERRRSYSRDRDDKRRSYSRELPDRRRSPPQSGNVEMSSETPRTFYVPDPPQIPPSDPPQHWSKVSSNWTAHLKSDKTGFDVRPIDPNDSTGCKLGPPSNAPDYNVLLEKYGIQVLAASGFLNHTGAKMSEEIYGRLAFADFRNPTHEETLEIHPVLRSNMWGKTTPQ
ncbi:PRP38-domain-containing protein, partial [Aureobasidium pullulans]